MTLNWNYELVLSAYPGSESANIDSKHLNILKYLIWEYGISLGTDWYIIPPNVHIPFFFTINWSFIPDRTLKTHLKTHRVETEHEKRYISPALVFL